jgi:hypothetical protein
MVTCVRLPCGTFKQYICLMAEGSMDYILDLIGGRLPGKMKPFLDKKRMQQ